MEGVNGGQSHERRWRAPDSVATTRAGAEALLDRGRQPPPHPPTPPSRGSWGCPLPQPALVSKAMSTLKAMVLDCRLMQR